MSGVALVEAVALKCPYLVMHLRGQVRRSMVPMVSSCVWVRSSDVNLLGRAMLISSF